MASYNRVILLGNLTRDPQVRYTPGGMAVSDIGLAVSRNWTDKQTNQRKEEVTFVDVTLWGRTAEIAGEYLSKGKQVKIEGRLQLDSWDDKETGQKRNKLKVVCENLTMTGSRQDSGGGGSRGPSGSSAPQSDFGGGGGYESQEDHSSGGGGFEPAPAGGDGDVPF